MDAKCPIFSKTKNCQLPKPPNAAGFIVANPWVKHSFDIQHDHGDGASKMQEGRSKGYSACVAHQTPASTIIQGEWSLAAWSLAAQLPSTMEVENDPIIWWKKCG